LVDATDGNRCHHHQHQDDYAETEPQAVTDFDVSDIHFLAL
jgi:hypothetical protein